MNDIPDIVSGNVKMYAADTKLYDNLKNSKSVQRDLDKLEQCYKFLYSYQLV